MGSSIDDLPAARARSDAAHELGVEGAEAGYGDAHPRRVHEKSRQVANGDHLVGNGAAAEVEDGENDDVAREAGGAVEDAVGERLLELHGHDLVGARVVGGHLLLLLGEGAHSAYVAQLLLGHVGRLGEHVLHLLAQALDVAAERDGEHGDGRHHAQTDGAQIRRHVEHHADAAGRLDGRAQAVAEILRYGEADHFGVRAQPVDELARLVLIEERHLLAHYRVEEALAQAHHDALARRLDDVDAAEVGERAHHEHARHHERHVAQLGLHALLVVVGRLDEVDELADEERHRHRDRARDDEQKHCARYFEALWPSQSHQAHDSVLV